MCCYLVFSSNCNRWPYTHFINLKVLLSTAGHPVFGSGMGAAVLFLNLVLFSAAESESVIFLSYLVTLHSFLWHVHFLFLVYPDVMLVCPDNVCIYTCYDVCMCVASVRACVRAGVCACVRACVYVTPDLTVLINNMSNMKIYLFLLSFAFVHRVVF